MDADSVVVVVATVTVARSSRFRPLSQQALRFIAAAEKVGFYDLADHLRMLARDGERDFLDVGVESTNNGRTEGDR